MTRFMTAITFAAIFLLTVATPASASVGWCKTDPLVMIDGGLADILVTAPLTAPLQVTGPTQIVVSVPVGVPADLILGDLGFGRGTEVSFREARNLRVLEHGIEVRVAVYVPAQDSSMPVAVEFAPRVLGILWPDRAEGTANEWVTLQVVF